MHNLALTVFALVVFLAVVVGIHSERHYREMTTKVQGPFSATACRLLGVYVGKPHGRAAARRDGRPFRRRPCPVHAGFAPALLYLGERQPAGEGGPGVLAGLAREAPLRPGAGTLAFTGIDSMQKRVYGHAKQGAKFGHTKIQGKPMLVRGLNALVAATSTPIAAPVTAATRLRGGNAASARGAASLATRAIGTAQACGCAGIIIAGPGR
jgi:hypothetical protein